MAWRARDAQLGWQTGQQACQPGKLAAQLLEGRGASRQARSPQGFQDYQDGRAQQGKQRLAHLSRQSARPACPPSDWQLERAEAHKGLGHAADHGAGLVLRVAVVKHVADDLRRRDWDASMKKAEGRDTCDTTRHPGVDTATGTGACVAAAHGSACPLRAPGPAAHNSWLLPPLSSSHIIRPPGHQWPPETGHEWWARPSRASPLRYGREASGHTVRCTERREALPPNPSSRRGSPFTKGS